MSKKKIYIVIAVALSLIAAVISMFLLFYDYDRLPVPTGDPTFDGNSQSLEATKIVPTLDASIDRKANLIWCASFLSAWKVLEADVAKEPISLMESSEVALALNEAPDPRPYIPKGNLYAEAGWNQKGIIDKITENLAQKFPDKAPPTFPGIAPESFVAYAYLEANIKFSLPYFQNREPLIFTDSEGFKTELNSFGIRPKDDYAYYKLRKQPRILYESRDENYKLNECIVDLDSTSTPNQIILALIKPENTLEETLSTIEDKSKMTDKKQGHDGISANDVLLVPDMVWKITHHFTELEGQEFTNSELKGQRIDVAQQDIQFRLDRSGAELKSESKKMMLPIPTYYVFDHPFLLQMKKRGAEMPYFVMWVENTELLKKWE